MTIAFVSSSSAIAIDPDLPLLLEAAGRRDLRAELAVWDDPGVDWSSYDAVVVRSCWDYIGRREEFLRWAATVPQLHNSGAILTWSTDKTYLQQLEAAGIPIIETRWDVAPGDDLGDHAEWVVKPTISAGSRDTARWETAEEAWEHSAALVAAGRTSMTQPYIASVDDEGETAMLYFSGTFSHAIRKGPLLERGEGVRQDRDSRETISPRVPSPEQRDLAERTIDAARTAMGLSSAPLYARVDLVTAPNGSPLVIELELAEPSLFLPQSHGGEDRLIDAVLARIAP
jgi:glutathione synthase/RimK-type ligase-like ATP-grasp enzyme